jgi:hypothetical protein
VGGGLGHAPASTGGAKPAPFTAESEPQLLRAGVTAQPQKAMREDTTLQGVVEVPCHRGRQASGVGISGEGGEKRLQRVSDYPREHGLARITGHIRVLRSFQRECHRGIGVLSRVFIELKTAFNCHVSTV